MDKWSRKSLKKQVYQKVWESFYGWGKKMEDQWDQNDSNRYG